MSEERWLDTLNPADAAARDGGHFRAIIAARHEVDQATGRLRTAVEDARRDGDSWTVIGAALGLSAQAARKQFDTKQSR